MFFTELAFYLFFAVILTVDSILPNKFRKGWLLAGSLFFYGYGSCRMLLLLLLCILVNYLAALSSRKKYARSVFIGAVVFNLSILGVFKYYHFFIANFEFLWQKINWHPGTLHLILPLGISFFTFQCISYIADVQKGKIPPCRSLPDFALFILFFPKIAVGPLVRAGDFLPQLERKLPWKEREVFGGIRQFVFGLFKKCFIADNLALFVDNVFANYEVFSGGTLTLAVLAYTFQILCDFSGYSDMAIGSAKLLGFKLNENFNFPYLAVNVTDFWRRWHISLSQWLRDYLYIPFGGNRCTPWKCYRNIFLTMLLGGLWHGAAWTFVLWGAWHGTLQCIYKFFKSKCTWTISQSIAIPVTFVLIALGWIPFRAGSFHQTLVIAGKIFTFAYGIAWFEPMSIGLVAFCLAYGLLDGSGILKKPLFSQKSVSGWAVIFFLIYVVLVFKPEGFQPFIYNQF